MSMPTITTSPNPISMSQAITDLIESIALEETALSHILNAEGEKLQKVLAMEDVSLNQILDVNETVMNMVTTVNDWSTRSATSWSSSPTTFITLPGKAAEACRTGLLPPLAACKKEKGVSPTGTRSFLFCCFNRPNTLCAPGRYWPVHARRRT